MHDICWSSSSSSSSGSSSSNSKGATVRVNVKCRMSKRPTVVDNGCDANHGAVVTLATVWVGTCGV